MDKRIIFAVAGSGKTTYVVDKLSLDKKSLIITYTDSNYENLKNKIINKFSDKWPENITLMTYFSFLYKFCYKPFLADKYKAKGLIFKKNANNYSRQDKLDYYMNKERFLYSNRLSLFLEKSNVIEDIKNRIEKYYDELSLMKYRILLGVTLIF